MITGPGTGPMSEQGFFTAPALDSVAVQQYRAALAPWVASSRRLVQLPTPRLHHPDLVVPVSVGRLAALALGCARVRLLQDGVIHKPPGSDRIELHRDATYTGFLTPLRVVSVRVALTHQSRESGCLMVAPGTHTAPWQPKLDVLGADIPAAPYEGPLVAVPLQPGQASVHHCLLLHGSFENRSPEPLQTLVYHCFDAACAFDPHLIPEESRGRFPMDATGRPDPETYPLLSV